MTRAGEPCHAKKNEYMYELGGWISTLGWGFGQEKRGHNFTVIIYERTSQEGEMA